jgi:hypothetical protein
MEDHRYLYFVGRILKGRLHFEFIIYKLAEER